MTVKGLDDILKESARLRERLQHAAGAGLYAAGNRVMTTAKDGLVPVDHGTLRGSGYVTLPDTEGGGAIVELGFGGPAEEYAVVQHEEQGFAHEVGTHQYLLKAVQAEADEVPRIAADYGAAALARTAQAIPSGGNPQTPWDHVQAQAKRKAAGRLRNVKKAKARMKAARMTFGAK